MSNPRKSNKSVSEGKSSAENGVSNQTVTEKDGQSGAKPLSLEIIDKLLRKNKFEVTEDNPEKRIYRKSKDQLADPESGPRASVNRLTKQLSPRVSEEHRDLFNECSEAFPNKREALERAIQLLAMELHNE
jgi:hypothetical protein